MTYPGGKDGAGVWQRLLNQIPPHDIFVSPFLGDCAVLRHKRPARLNVGIDTAPRVLELWATRAMGGFPVQLYLCDGVEWLSHSFGLHRIWPRLPPVSAAAPGGAFVFADPPYQKSTRRDGERDYYLDDDWTDGDHARLLTVLLGLPCYVMVTHYPSPLYSEMLGRWRTFTFQAMTRGGPATEQVWMNYAQPGRLHDPRWLGGGKREREKLVRRRRNLLGKLRRLPALERQALLQAAEELEA